MMLRLIKKITFLMVASAIVFVVFAMMGGGDAFRWIGEETGGVIQEGSDWLSEAADDLKEKTNALKETIGEWVQRAKEYIAMIAEKVRGKIDN